MIKMTICKQCGAEYMPGSSGFAGLCNGCIEKLAKESAKDAGPLQAQILSELKEKSRQMDRKDFEKWKEDWMDAYGLKGEEKVVIRKALIDWQAEEYIRNQSISTEMPKKVKRVPADAIERLKELFQ